MFNLVSKFNNTGSVLDAPKTGRPRTVRTLDNSDIVASAYVESPKKSTRRASKELQISRSSLQRIITDIGLKPYKPHLLHALNEDDPDKRMQFCEIFLSYYDDSPDIVDQILWTDEASFKLNGHVNRHNCVYWCHENPHKIIEQEVNLPGITVWAGITSAGLVGPFFFRDTVTGHSYLNMLSDQLWPIISTRPDIDIDFTFNKTVPLRTMRFQLGTGSMTTSQGVG